MEFLNKHTWDSINIQYVFDLLLPHTPYGMQKKKEMKPYKRGEEDLLNIELDKIEAVIKAMKYHEGKFKQIILSLDNIKEIRSSINRAAEGMVLDEVELFEIKNFMITIAEIVSVQEKIPSLPEDLIIKRHKSIEKLLDPEGLGNRTFYIYDSYSESLSSIRKEKNKLQGRIEEEKKRVISSIEEEVGITPKLSGELVISKRNDEMLKKARNCPCLSEEVSTLLTVNFKVKKDEKMLCLLEELEDVKFKEDKEEYRVKEFLSGKIGYYKDEIYEIIERLAGFDFIIAKAGLSNLVGGKRPGIHDETSIYIKKGRHIKLEHMLRKKKREFTPISFYALRGVTVITGANMGGKTISLKLAGLLSAMAQYGLYVPAEEFKTCLFDFIYFSIGDMQSIESGLSTFGAEVSGMIDILKHSRYKGLILIDELARGTNPKEGYSISRAIVRYLLDKESITLFTTHFEGITHEKGVEHLQVRGLKDLDFEMIKERIDEGQSGIELVLENMDYSLERVEGSYAPPKDAINIARLMGLDDIILKWAEEIMISGKEE